MKCGGNCKIIDGYLVNNKYCFFIGTISDDDLIKIIDNRQIHIKD